MKPLIFIAIAGVLAAGPVFAQDTESQTQAREALRRKMAELDSAATVIPPVSTNAPTDGRTPTVVVPSTDLEEAAEEGWAFSIYASTYLQEGDRDYFQPTFTADRGWLHLEARYNYEDYETASFFVGYNLNFEHGVSVTLTPMVGVALGDTDGFAPAFRLAAEWRRLALYSEGEYFFDTDHSEYDYFYNWSELNLDATHGFHVGLVMQKETSEDVRRGFSVGYGWEMEKLGEVDLTTYFFDLDKADEMYVFAVVLSF